MGVTHDSVPPNEEKGDLPDLNEAQTSHEADMATWNKNWGRFYPLTLDPKEGWSIDDALVACKGGRPLNPDRTFDQIVSDWDGTLLENEKANPDKGLALTIEQLGPRPEVNMYPDVDIEMHDFRAKNRLRAWQRRETVQNKVPSLKPAAKADEITEPPPQGATRSIPPPTTDKPRETLPSGARRDLRRSAVPRFSVAPPPSTGVLGPQGVSDVSVTLTGYQPPVTTPKGDEEELSFADIDVEDDGAAVPDESGTEARGFFELPDDDVTQMRPLEGLIDLPAVRDQDALRARGLAAHAEYTAQEELAKAHISYPPSVPSLMVPPPAGDTSSPCGRRLLNLEERSVTEAVAAIAMPGSGYSGEAQGFDPRKSMIRRGAPPDVREEDEEFASLAPTTASEMRSQTPPAVEDLERFERAQAEARSKLLPSGRTTLEGMAPASAPATEALPVAPRVSRPPATPQPAVMARAPTPKPPASDEDVRKLSIHELAQAATQPPPITEPRRRGPITDNQGFQSTPPHGVQKTIVRPFPTKTIGLVLGGVLLVAALFAGVITKLQYVPPAPPVSTASLAETTTRSVPAAAPTPPPPTPKVCLAQTAFDQLTLDEQNGYFGCKSRRDEAPLFRCQISAAETREARLPFCRLVRDTCRILPGVAVTPAQAACLANPIGHAAPAPSP